MDKDLDHLGRLPPAPAETDTTGTCIRVKGHSPSNRVPKHDAQVLDEIEAALQRLESGRFGYCVKCGAKIDILRLTHDPTASICLRCLTLDEDDAAT